MSTTSRNIVTRFAPSPTGFLHIGGARTALFNWLFAKANNGKMLLRIEDTDRERSTDEAVAAIVDGLSWLGLDWDGEAISQYGRVARHREIAEKMVADGTAYYCYATPEELEQMREKAKEDGRPALYDRRWRDRDPTEAPKGISPAIRLKAPLEGETIINDQVQGEVKFANKELDDLVLLRSDGNPTYMLAVVVDDHDMGVTHIIRGDDHLTNAARQSLIYKALGWQTPVMAHIPLIHGPDGAKLSKRHGALGAEAYRAMGYLPEALRNYLVRLGWSHGDDEIMSIEQMADWFGFDGMGKSAARFDLQKLDALNGHYIRQVEDEVLIESIGKILGEIEPQTHLGKALQAGEKEKLLKAMPALKQRAKTLAELIAASEFIFSKRPLTFEDKAAAALDDDAKNIIAQLLPELEALGAWSHDALNEVMRNFAETSELKFGKVAQPLRAALTGKNASPGVFDVMEILGRDEALARLKDQL